MSELKGIPGELRATIHVTRKATGKTETYNIIGHSDPEKLKELVEAERAKKVHGASGAMVGQIGGINNHPKE